LKVDIPFQISCLFDKKEEHEKVVDIYGIDFELLDFAGIT